VEVALAVQGAVVLELVDKVIMAVPHQEQLSSVAAVAEVVLVRLELMQ
jgi:hypothetical protein